jgi:hypothetical protein
MFTTIMRATMGESNRDVRNAKLFEYIAGFLESLPGISPLDLTTVELLAELRAVLAWDPRLQTSLFVNVLFNVRVYSKATTEVQLRLLGFARMIYNEKVLDLLPSFDIHHIVSDLILVTTNPKFSGLRLLVETQQIAQALLDCIEGIFMGSQFELIDLLVDLLEPLLLPELPGWLQRRLMGLFEQTLQDKVRASSRGPEIVSSMLESRKARNLLLIISVNSLEPTVIANAITGTSASSLIKWVGAYLGEREGTELGEGTYVSLLRWALDRHSIQNTEYFIVNEEDQVRVPEALGALRAVFPKASPELKVRFMQDHLMCFKWSWANTSAAFEAIPDIIHWLLSEALAAAQSASENVEGHGRALLELLIRVLFVLFRHSIKEDRSAPMHIKAALGWRDAHASNPTAHAIIRNILVSIAEAVVEISGTLRPSLHLHAFWHNAVAVLFIIFDEIFCVDGVMNPNPFSNPLNLLETFEGALKYIPYDPKSIVASVKNTETKKVDLKSKNGWPDAELLRLVVKIGECFWPERFFKPPGNLPKSMDTIEYQIQKAMELQQRQGFLDELDIFFFTIESSNIMVIDIFLYSHLILIDYEILSANPSTNSFASIESKPFLIFFT